MQKSKLKFSVLTATLCRDDLIRCLQSIDAQMYDNIEHIVIIDGKDKYRDFVKDFEKPYRTFITLPRGFNNVGNTPRFVGSYFATGDYICHIDEDDYYINDTFAVLEPEIEKLGRPDWFVFPALRFGGIFFNPPGHSMTMNNQFMYKPIIKGKQIRYTQTDAYCGDGELVEELKLLTPGVMIDTKVPLVCVDISHHAKRDD